MPKTTSLVPALGCVYAVLLVLLHDLQRQRARHYLTRLSLPVFPRSAWRCVLDSVDGRGLVNTTGFDRATFSHLLSLFTPLWESQRQRRTAITAVDVLGLVLQYLNSTARQKTLCQVFALPPATLSRHLRRGLAVLLNAVRNDADCRITWPPSAEMQQSCARMAEYGTVCSRTAQRLRLRRWRLSPLLRSRRPRHAERVLQQVEELLQHHQRARLLNGRLHRVGAVQLSWVVG